MRRPDKCSACAWIATLVTTLIVAWSYLTGTESSKQRWCGSNRATRPECYEFADSMVHRSLSVSEIEDECKRTGEAYSRCSIHWMVYHVRHDGDIYALAVMSAMLVMQSCDILRHMYKPRRSEVVTIDEKEAPV